MNFSVSATLSEDARAGAATRPIHSGHKSLGLSMRALVVDDHPGAADTLEAMAGTLDHRVQIVLAASVAAARALLVLDASYDLVLVDLEDGAASARVLGELRESHPSLPIVLVPSREQAGMGALALLASSSPGTSVVAPQPVSSAATKISLMALGVTRRQGDVLALLLEGQSNKVIARTLNLSVDTVKDHMARLMRTLNVTSRTQAVLAVTQMAQDPGRPGLRA